VRPPPDSAGQDARAATDPDISGDPNGPTKLKPPATLNGIARMIGSVDVHGRTDLCAIADAHLANIQDHAVEVQERT
jgi:hypothetical protein